MQQPCFIRTLDDLCRVAIPKDIRKSFRLDAGDDLCVGVEGSRIVITPVKNALFDPQFGEVLGQKYGHAFGIYSKESRVQGFATPVEVPETWTHYWPEVNRRFPYNDYYVYPVVSKTTSCNEGYVVVPREIDNYSYTTAIVDLLSMLV